eukprot:CAMPEP_0113468774 /NCGR_PEP_ID=MMETSP0014_2-20120614/15537_1 /TAXON_ID=2857 /ORGANISM="Nitzschia sp." /LENGTH=918 /DNA_ID=CAMNT_0000361191 /DNA_START=255 /DNA_END=3008 /DNA_ORIENTATION=- /assembly_acc=CAM_ASM_000159
MKRLRKDGFVLEITKDNDRDDRGHWHHIELLDSTIPGSNSSNSKQPTSATTGTATDNTMAVTTTSGTTRPERYLPLIERFVMEQNATAIVMLSSIPMLADNWTDIVDLYRTNPSTGEQVTFLSVFAAQGGFFDAFTDDDDDDGDYDDPYQDRAGFNQLQYLHSRYVDGLVSQLPWDVGFTLVDVMVDTVIDETTRKEQEGGQMKVDKEDKLTTPSSTTKADKTVTRFYPSNIVAYYLIPLDLPPLEVDQNLLGPMKLVGLVCFGIVALTVVVCIGWTVYYRKTSLVVVAAQPLFLVFLATGVLIMSATLIPLSWDDNGRPLEVSSTTAKAVCMSQPWLAFIGFSITFGILFSKTWRVNLLMRKSAQFKKTLNVKAKDVLGPFAVVLVMNLTILIVWTIVDPLTYRRQFSDGTDQWNRELESTGSCKCNNAAAFAVPLALINFIVVLIACWQAVSARHIKSEFSESKYIGLAVASMCQAFLTGIPIVAMVRNTPEAYYLLVTFLIFLLSMVVLLLIFLPKMLMQWKYSRLPKSEQRKMMTLAISVKRSQRSSEFFPSNRDYSSGLFPPPPNSSFSARVAASAPFRLQHHPQQPRISGLHVGEHYSSSTNNIRPFSSSVVRFESDIIHEESPSEQPMIGSVGDKRSSGGKGYGTGRISSKMPSSVSRSSRSNGGSTATSGIHVVCSNIGDSEEEEAEKPESTSINTPTIVVESSSQMSVVAVAHDVDSSNCNMAATTESSGPPLNNEIQDVDDDDDDSHHDDGDSAGASAGDKVVVTKDEYNGKSGNVCGGGGGGDDDDDDDEDDDDQITSLFKQMLALGKKKRNSIIIQEKEEVEEELSGEDSKNVVSSSSGAAAAAAAADDDDGAVSAIAASSSSEEHTVVPPVVPPVPVVVPPPSLFMNFLLQVDRDELQLPLLPVQ